MADMIYHRYVAIIRAIIIFIHHVAHIDSLSPQAQYANVFRPVHGSLAQLIIADSENCSL